jgi:TonB family protein
MRDPSPRDRKATLSIAVAVSVAVHLSTLAALVGVDGGPRAWTRAVAVATAPALEARLVARTTAEPPAAPPVAATDAALSPPARPTEPLAPENVANASPAAGTGERSPVGWRPRVLVNDRVPRARFGDALDGDALAAFLTEVDAGVALPERFEVPYPRAALDARKEGTVLVWAVIDDQGRVDDVHVVDGDPEFAETVDTALRATRFGPARNLGRNIPFYVTLEFEFRLDAAGGKVAAERARGASR